MLTDVAITYGAAIPASIQHTTQWDDKMTDLEQLEALFLTGPDGEALCISSDLISEQGFGEDARFRFTVTHAPTGHRWGIVADITELTNVPVNPISGKWQP